MKFNVSFFNVPSRTYLIIYMAHIILLLGSAVLETEISQLGAKSGH